MKKRYITPDSLVCSVRLQPLALNSDRTELPIGDTPVTDQWTRRMQWSEEMGETF
ncbi:MAG: hypothetical protein J6M53_09945 [Bacteroidaceae bacterium]|nr:hypothetical protein [Bacteroidaceae bacterium]